MKKLTNYGKMLICMALVLILSIGATISITMTYFGDSKSGSVEIKIGASIYFAGEGGIGVAVQDGASAIVPSQSVDVDTTLKIMSSSNTNVTKGVLKVIPSLSDELEGASLTLTDGKTYDVYLGGSESASTSAKMVVANNALYLVKASNSEENTSSTLNELYEITPSTSGLQVKFSVPVTFSSDINNDLSGQSCTIEMKGIVLQSSISGVEKTINDFEPYFSSMIPVPYTTETVSGKEYIYFGSYPQTIKASSVTITSEPVDENGYYTGSDGEKYAKRTETVNSKTFGDGTQSVSGTDYYFKVEPIKWRVLEKSDGKAMLLCDSVITSCYYQGYVTIKSNSLSVSNISNDLIEIDSKEFKSNSLFSNSSLLAPLSGDDMGYYYVSDGEGGVLIDNGEYVKGNNYKWSTLRSHLNNDFYNTAFKSYQKPLIQVTEVNNGPSSANTSSNPNLCDNTFDKLFVLSYQEYLNTSYGFSSSTSASSTRVFPYTDYVVCDCGDYMYWTRTPSDEGGEAYYAYACYVGTTTSDNGELRDSNVPSGTVNYYIRGVVPALWMSL